VTMGPLHGTIFLKRLSVNIATHHQKFMVVKKGEETYAFCGGLDIESRKTPSTWGYTPDKDLIGWHDIHVKMRGPIARDLEKEFTLRWNRESGNSTVVPSPNPWSGFATLPVPSPAGPGDVDFEEERRQEDVQMERTVSSDDTIGFTTNQDNNKQIYKNIVNASQSFMYFENQYFRSTDLADWIVAKATAVPSMPVIFVVVFTAGFDDKANEITQHGEYLQHEFFDRVVKALGSRAAIYTMTGRSVHSKFLLTDDRYMTIGSANANERGFQLDSELNVAIDDSKLATAFRKRLWAHNLGVTEATIAGWGVADYIAQWEAVAASNETLAPSAMAGEGVVHWDYTKAPGSSHFYVPDYLADNDADHGDQPNNGGLLAVNDDPAGDLVTDDGTAIA
jgi:phosphatidylserine/phosphatidylglycerophosphate/cardiolipin synthase-like enzyme